ncbi:MAG: GIY-YIG nuclease family protein [Thermodesulfobacteriota bacterium]
MDYKGKDISVTMVCRIHGAFQRTPNAHLSQKQGCAICGRLRQAKFNSTTQEEFISKAKSIHKNKYDYSLVKYIKGNKKVIIICPVHGAFSQIPESHLYGRGCFECGCENKAGVYNEKLFNRRPEVGTQPGTLYFIKFFSEAEKPFYKIGITIRPDYRTRFYGKKKGGYGVEVLFTRTSTLYDSWKVERKFLSKYKPFKYVPKHKFAGAQECFLFKDTEVLSVLSELKESNAS